MDKIWIYIWLTPKSMYLTTVLYLLPTTVSGDIKSTKNISVPQYFKTMMIIGLLSVGIIHNKNPREASRSYKSLEVPSALLHSHLYWVHPSKQLLVIGLRVLKNISSVNCPAFSMTLALKILFNVIFLPVHSAN